MYMNMNKKRLLLIPIIIFTLFFNLINANAETKKVELNGIDGIDDGKSVTVKFTFKKKYYPYEFWAGTGTLYATLCNTETSLADVCGSCVGYCEFYNKNGEKKKTIEKSMGLNETFWKDEDIDSVVLVVRNKAKKEDDRIQNEKGQLSRLRANFNNYGLCDDTKGNKMLSKNFEKYKEYGNVKKICKIEYDADAVVDSTTSAKSEAAADEQEETQSSQSVDWPSLDEIKDLKDIISPNMKNIKSCEELLEDADDLKNIIQTIVNITKIMVPIGLIIFGVLDFGKAIFSADENKMKEAQAKFTKRLIIALAFFLIPVVLKILLTIANQIWGGIDTSLCGIEL